jgi:hypothetical protein
MICISLSGDIGRYYISDPTPVLFSRTVNGSVLESEEQVLAACEVALCLAPAEWLPDLPISNELLGVPDWYPFEHAVWPVGGNYSAGLLSTFPAQEEYISNLKVAEVAVCRNLRHGRQSFIMALGSVGARQNREHL